jgi:Cytochrome c554 and c-prime
MRKWIALGLLFVGQFYFVGHVCAQGAVEKIAAHLHEGVASCAASQCHGATQVSSKEAVQMNEFALWQEFDPHAKAYDILLTPTSQAIASKLGLGKAEEAKVCLDCHADNVPTEKRGERFQMDDGVGCEACHGGSENWLASHSKAAHAENLQAGLYPTEEPIARSALCLSCHAGTRDRMITHRIMGAGHPRLSFELDTFTWLHPHYQVDADYEKRKGKFDGLRDWGIGQGTAALNALDILLDERTGWHGIFPELVLFDCHACHRSMSGRQWGPRQGTGLGPGVVRLNDSNLVMFRHVLAAVDSAGAQSMFDKTRRLHLATTERRHRRTQCKDRGFRFRTADAGRDSRQHDSRCRARRVPRFCRCRAMRDGRAERGGRVREQRAAR